MSKKKNKKKKVNRKIKIIVQLIILLVLLIMICGLIIFYGLYGRKMIKMQSEAKALVKQSTIDTFRQSETSIVYDTNKKVISTLKGEKDVYYMYYEDIPQYVKDAMISIEDKKFLSHNGVDFKANIRAMLSLIKHKGKVTQGASTITQQLSRNIFLSHEVSWERKVKEIFISIELEKKYKKYEILEFYLNNIYFSNGHYGIQAASKGYFSKDVSELSLSQIVFLCAIPNNPTLYDPVTNPENTIKRRNRILKQMYEDEKISEEEYNEAVAETITLNMKEEKKSNYVETFVYYSATRALMKARGFVFRNEFNDAADREMYDEDYEELYNECQKSLFSGGYRIYTSIDMKKQKALQNSVNTVLEGFTEKSEEGIYTLQGAAACIDNENGRVVAVVGGRSQKTQGYTLNRSYQTFRQPGSTIKPLIVYTPAFQKGYYPEQILVDKKFEGGPSNSDNKYSGKITLRRAVERSKNTIAWQVFEDITPQTGLQFLLDMNFSKIKDSDYGLASSLGGFTIGVSPVEMASGYAAIENDGYYREPTCIVRITDSKGEEIVADKVIEKPVYEQNAARTMTNVLEGVIKNGTGAGLSLGDMPSAGKTGTTNKKKDGWFVGYTRYYTTSVWVGYDIPRTLNDLTGAKYPGAIWKDYMLGIHEGLEAKSFEPYESKYKPVKTAEPTVEPTAEPTIEPEIDIPDDDIDEETDNDYGDIIPSEGDIPTIEPEVTLVPEVTPEAEIPTLPPDDILPIEGDGTVQ